MKDMETASPATQVCWELAQQTRADDVLIVGVGTPLAAAAALLARAILHPSLTILFGTAVAPRKTSQKMTWKLIAMRSLVSAAASVLGMNK